MSELAVKFYRVSSDGQDEANQVSTVDKHFAANGYVEAREPFKLHDVSASKGEHEPQLDEILADIRAGLYTVVVIANSARIDRRDPDKQQFWALSVRIAGGRIESASEPEFGKSTLSGRMVTMLAQQANYDYTQTLAKNVRNSFDRIDANGAIRGKALYGYAITGVKYVKTLEIIEDEAQLIRDAVEWYLQGMTLAAICRKLNNAGRLTRPVKHNGITKAREWSPKTLGQVLRSETLIGRRHQGDTVVSVPAIILVRDWEAVQAKLDAKAYRKGVRTHGDTAFLTSLLFCAKCGRPMYKITGGYGASRGNYYYCRPVNGVSCKVMIPLADLDNAVLDHIRNGYDGEFGTREIEIPGHNWQNDIDLLGLAMSDLKRSNFASTADYLAQLNAMGAEMAELESREDVPPTTKTVTMTFDDFRAMWDAMDMSERREFLVSLRMQIMVTKTGKDDVSLAFEYAASSESPSQ